MQIGVGDKYLHLIVLYNKPTARIGVGDTTTDPIIITRGTRQGCPLSPLLYAIVAEPLACALREYYGHRGVRYSDYRLIISAYADDTLLYIRDPERNLSPVLREVVRFGDLSGLKINWDKSIIFPLAPSTT